MDRTLLASRYLSLARQKWGQIWVGQAEDRWMQGALAFGLVVLRDTTNQSLKE